MNSYSGAVLKQLGTDGHGVKLEREIEFITFAPGEQPGRGTSEPKPGDN